MREFTAVFERDGEWWVGSVLELPGALTQGATIEEARENLKDAIQVYLEDCDPGDVPSVRELTRERIIG